MALGNAAKASNISNGIEISGIEAMASAASWQWRRGNGNI